MSWFSVPLTNPFKSLIPEPEHEPDPESPNDAVSPTSGLKDDLSTIGETLGRQFRGVAAFLAPPPPTYTASATGDGDGSPTSINLAGIRSDLAEIGGSFKTSISEISNLASNLFRLSEENVVRIDDRKKNDDYDDYDDDDDDGDDDYDGEDEDEGVGITDEVIEFATKISNRPELWTDFPLSIEQEFDMSDAQSQHAAIIEQFVPSLADLRDTLRNDLSEKQFWIIYFILLLPRLNEDDLELLSTPEIVEARETLLLMLRSKNSEITSDNPTSDGPSNADNKVNDEKTEKSQSSEEKATKTENFVASKSKEHEKPVTSVHSNDVPKRFESEEDVSFSDLEDDNDDRLSQSRGASSAEWVRLKKSRGKSSSRERLSEGGESSDWLKVDDFDP